MEVVGHRVGSGEDRAEELAPSHLLPFLDDEGVVEVTVDREEVGGVPNDDDAAGVGGAGADDLAGDDRVDRRNDHAIFAYLPSPLKKWQRMACAGRAHILLVTSLTLGHIVPPECFGAGWHDRFPERHPPRL